MNYDMYYPVSVPDQFKFIESYASEHPMSDLIWISENRDFGEQERYKEKDAVDDALINSASVSDETDKIKSLFTCTDDQLSAAKKYDKMLKTELKELTDIYMSGLEKDRCCTIEDIRGLWEKIKVLSDIDNAHAMYLSSDNWPFSVFHKIIDNISDAIDNDFELLGDLLTAGMQDVRTSVFRDCTGAHAGFSREEHINAVVSEKDLVRSNGVLPFFTFIAETGKKVDVVSAEQISSTYSNAKEKALSKAPADKAEILKSNIEAYELLYADRVTYDIYEYYGFYSFIRNALILKSAGVIENHSGSEAAEHFKYLASTYQFDKIKI